MADGHFQVLRLITQPGVVLDEVLPESLDLLYCLRNEPFSTVLCFGMSDPEETAKEAICHDRNPRVI
jgi:hypothetical protein